MSSAENAVPSDHFAPSRAVTVSVFRSALQLYSWASHGFGLSDGRITFASASGS